MAKVQQLKKAGEDNKATKKQNQTESMKEAHDIVENVSNKLVFFSRAVESDDFDQCDAKILVEYLNQQYMDLQEAKEMLEPQKAT